MSRCAGWVRLIVVCAVALAALVLQPQLALAHCHDADGEGGDEDVYIEVTKCIPGDRRDDNEGDNRSPIPVGATGRVTFTESRWAALCASNEQADSPANADRCGTVRTCPGGVMASRWTREVVTRDGEYIRQGGWELAGNECVSFDPENPPARFTALPQVTAALVLRELRRVGLPDLQIRVQPADKTLVNFETIFYAEPQPFERRLRLLGQDVDVRAEPSSFNWAFGDGATMRTEVPGAPYPDKTIVHEYADARVTVEPSVAVTYTAEFRVDGGGWQPIAETITIPGPPTDLRITEATPVLTGTD